MGETTEIIEPNGSDQSKVESWRLHVLMEAGYPLPLAERLAGSEADLHRAVELVGPGLRARDGRRDFALVSDAGGSTLAHPLSTSFEARSHLVHWRRCG